MSIALVISRGYGNGTFSGTITDIVTRGYAISDEPPPVVEDRNKGGWLSEEQVRELQRLIRESGKRRDRSRKKRDQKARTRLAELKRIYDQVNGLIPAEVVAPVAEIVRPFSAPSDMPLPPAMAIDWDGLLRSREAVQALSAAILEAARARSEDDELLMLMMMA